MRKYLAGLALLGMVGTVSAFPASINAVDRTATLDNAAEFEVQVKNDFATQKRFRISSISSPPPTGSWFGYSNSKTVEPGETNNFSITVTPPETAIQQNYRFDVNIRTLEGDAHEKLSNYFSVRSQNDIKILYTGINSNKFLPGDQITSNITVFNTASSPLNYELEASTLNKTSSKSGAIVSGTQRTHSFKFKVPKETPPGEYDMRTAVTRENQEGDSVSQTFEVGSLENVEFWSQKEDRVFEYSEFIHAANNGNSETKVELNKTLPGYMAPITSFNTSFDRAEEVNGGKIYYWSFNVKPGEEVAISYKTRYWPPLVVLSVIIIGILLIKRLYTGLNFTKQVRRTEEGVKIHIEIENRSNHKVDELKVTDFIPDIASVEENFPMAKPVIRKTNNGTRLIWEIESMEPGEQRVFEYVIKPLVEVEGGVTLPEAELEIEDQRIAETNEENVEFKPE
jgi:hypothetical protein